MRKLIFLIVFLFSGLSLYAGTDSIDFNKVKFGMGGGLGFSTSIYDNFEYYGYTVPTKIVLPIQIFRYFRLEPIFSLSVSKYKDKDGEYSDMDTWVNFMGGAGFFFTYPFDAAMIIAGARFGGGINHYKSENENRTRTRYNRVFLAEPVIGADYFLNDHFSIGCEITLGFFYFGGNVYGEGYEEDHDDDDDSYALMIRTGGTLFFRFYFF